MSTDYPNPPDTGASITPMTIETTAAPGAAAETIAPQSTETPNASTPAVGASAQTPQAETGANKPGDQGGEQGNDADQSFRRWQRRADRATAARYQAEAHAQQLEAELARYRQQEQQAAPKDGETQAARPEDIDRMAMQRAEEIATVRQVAERSNKVFSEGSKAFGEEIFRQSIAAVSDEAGPLIGTNGRATPLGEAILDSDAPAKLLHYLGQNPEIAEGLRGLGAAQIGRRIARIEAEMQTKTAPPPKPLKPIVPTGGASLGRSEAAMTDAEWYAARRVRK